MNDEFQTVRWYNRVCMNSLFRGTLLGLVFLVLGLRAQNNWREPFPAHRIIGNVYYVGTADLACFLITSPRGHILINSGLEDSAPLIQKSIAALGFRFEDVKVLLTMQGHYDHVAAFAEIQKKTGAQVWATEGDAALLQDGGKSDFHFGNRYNFAPVRVSRRLHDGEAIDWHGTKLLVHLTPGHTKGSVSYSMTVNEGGRTYAVLFANMGSINPGVKLVNNPKYPNIAADYARTFRVQKELACDVFLAGHGSQYGLAEKYKPGQAYDPQRFVDGAGYRRAVEEYERKYREQLAGEQAAAR